MRHKESDLQLIVNQFAEASRLFGLTHHQSSLTFTMEYQGSFVYVLLFMTLAYFQSVAEFETIRKVILPILNARRLIIYIFCAIREQTQHR